MGRRLLGLAGLPPVVEANSHGQCSLPPNRSTKKGGEDVGELSGHADNCPKCHRETASDEAYCRACGAPLYNGCTACEYRVNPPDAAFCIRCGEPTQYNRLGFVRPFEG